MHGPFTTRFPVFLIALFVFFIAASSNAEPPALSTDGRICGAQAATYLDARLAIWQQRMNLADWKISLVVSHASDLKPKTLGNVHWDTKNKTAVIRVLDPADYRVACRDALSDMEMTVVHELVHLELSSLPRSQASRHDEELAVNRIAEALIRLDRQGPPASPSANNLRAGAPADSGDITASSR